MGWRPALFLSFFFIAAAIIVGCLFYIQIINHKFYRAQALGQQVGFKEIRGARGRILVENSKESRGRMGTGTIKSLAINRDKWLAFAIPQKISDKNSFASILSSTIDIPQESILEKLEISDSYVILKKDLSDEEVSKIKEIESESLNLEAISSRYYPQEDMLAQVVGFVGGNNDGQYGIEGYYDNILKGKKGIREQRQGLAVIGAEDPINFDGSDLYLTIDYNIQFEAESLLKEAYKTLNQDSGQIIVMKPDSGRILAMVNFPAFDVNKYSKEKDLGIFQNSAIQKLYEPGSVFKPFTMAMALQEGKIAPGTTFVDTGSVTIGPDTISNFDHKKYGTQTMSDILEKSINTGAVFLSQQIRPQKFLDYIKKLGLDEKTGIDLQGEVYSENTLLKTGSPFGFATASFGQGIEMTPIQLARAFCVFANHGRIPNPYIVEKITNGHETKQTRQKLSDQIISEKTAADVTDMLINVVEKGFGDGAKIPGYYLAGKTGTAQVAYENKKGYYPDKTIQSFIGYGPALDPQFLILVKLDNPKVPQSSLSAVPIFKKLSQYIISYWQIPPDYEK